MSELRRQALKAFKQLHRTRQIVFRDDKRALDSGRQAINEHFRKNRNETNESEIKKMIELAGNVNKELRTNVIQAVEKQEGVYELRITEDVTRLDNVAFNPNAVVEKKRRRSRRGAETSCSGGMSPKTDAEIEKK